MHITAITDTQTKRSILAALEANDHYCPCKLERKPENKCMCQEFRDMAEGVCHCGLYIKTKD